MPLFRVHNFTALESYPHNRATTKTGYGDLVSLKSKLPGPASVLALTTIAVICVGSCYKALYTDIMGSLHMFLVVEGRETVRAYRC